MGDKIIGPGVLYRAPVATNNPDESTVDWGEAWGGSWTDMGDFPEGSGINFNLSDDIYEAYSERSTLTQLVVRTRRKGVVKFSLFDHSVANMAIVLQGTAETTPAAGGGQKGFTEIPFGSQPDVNFYKWGIEAFRLDANNTKQPVRWFFHKGFLRPTGDLAYAKTKETAVPCEIVVIGDDSQDDGEDMGILQIVTAAATAT